MERHVLYEVLLREGECEADRLADARAKAEAKVRHQFGDAAVDLTFAQGITKGPDAMRALDENRTDWRYLPTAWCRCTFHAP